MKCCQLVIGNFLRANYQLAARSARYFDTKKKLILIYLIKKMPYPNLMDTAFFVFFGKKIFRKKTFSAKAF